MPTALVITPNTGLDEDERPRTLGGHGRRRWRYKMAPDRCSVSEGVLPFGPECAAVGVGVVGREGLCVDSFTTSGAGPSGWA